MTKRDFKKELDCYKAKNHRLCVLDVPPMNYLMIDGHGDPNTSPHYIASIQALFPIAYKLKFSSKKELGKDYVVMPLEGLWWADDMSSFTSMRDKSLWKWTLMIMQPEWITAQLFENARAIAKQKSDNEKLDCVRLECLNEGKCVQTLHIGSFDDEAEILAKMHDEFIPANNLKMTGKHHEIYFSDFRKVAPEKLRTILRQPVTTL